MSRVAAAGTQQGAFEVVIVYPVAVSVGAAVPKDVLCAFVEVVADQRFVAAGIDLAFPGDVSDVVGVAQHVVEGGCGNRSARGVLARRWGRQPEVGHGRLEIVESVVAGCVELPCLHDEWRTLFIDLDGVDLPAFEHDAGVDVSEFGAIAGAAVHCLVQQLDADVLAGELVLGVVEDVGDGGHHVGVDTFAEVLARGDQLHAHVVELSLGDRGVDVVAERSGSRVDDDVLDLRILLEVGDHLLEHRPLLDRAGRDAGLDELLDDRRR
ncbi:hypothetical protein VMT40_32390 [Nocardia sp. CDC160]|nr:hypothetical protein [Nocardia sp. CDC160]MEC3919333.1 hypothetical protein [Nocardia sp. CDC160]